MTSAFETVSYDTNSGPGPAALPVPEPVVNDMAARLMESLNDFDDLGWRLVGGGDAVATHTGGPRYYRTQTSAIRDRQEGRYWPFYDNEYDLRRQRAACRSLETFTAVATGLRTSLEVYTMGGEWEFKVEAKAGAENAPEGLLAAMQQVIDQNLERNEWVGDLDRECHNAVRQDGDLLLAIYPRHDGLSDWRRLEADCVTEPRSTKRQLDRWLDVDPKRSHWSFGVHTVYDERQRRIDHTQHAGYHVAFNDSGSDWDYLPSWPQPHIEETHGSCAVMWKRNTPRSAKRGVSDYLPIQVDLERESKLTENLSIGATILAAIPWIEEHAEGVDRTASVSQLETSLLNFSRRYGVASAINSGHDRQGTGRPTTYYAPGTVPKVSAGHKYHAGPAGTVRTNLFIEASQHLMRRAGVRFLSPEYMITGDASNAAFSSTLVAESPFTKAREADQGSCVRFLRGVLWRSLRVAFLAGRFSQWVGDWSKLVAMVELVINPPPVATRDKAAQINELNSLYDRQLIDGATYLRELGHDPEPQFEGRYGPGTPPAPAMGFGGEGLASAPQERSAYESRLVDLRWSLLEGKTLHEDCGTGAGGFKAGNKCQKKGGGSASRSSGITRKERHAVEDYTTDRFQDINGGLRSGGLSGEDSEIVDNLDGYLSKSKKRPGATVRSFDIEPGGDIDAMLRPGATFSDPAFLSTRKQPTLSDAGAFRNRNAPEGRVVMRIDGKNGVDISGLSANPGEGEVLYPRGTKFQVKKVVRTKNGGILAELEELTESVRAMESIGVNLTVSADGYLVLEGK